MTSRLMAKFRHSSLPLAGLIVIGATLLPAQTAAQAGGQGGMTVRGTVLHNLLMNDCLQEACPRDLALTRNQDWTPPPAAVNVVVRGTDIVAKTDRQGNYEISVPSPDAELVFLYVGYERVAVPVEGRSVINVRLVPTPLPLVDRLLGLIMRQVEVGVYPNLDELAVNAGTNRETARDMVWLVIGNRVMMREYPGEFFPDYRFPDQY